MRQPAKPTFVEVAASVFVWRYPVLDVNIALVLGAERALLVDTLSTTAQATDLLDEVRRITAVPLVVLNTHHHFDHCFGNAVFAATGAPVLAHPATAALLRDNGDELRSQVYAEWSATEPELASAAAGTELYPPDTELTGPTELDLGGRSALVDHNGLGHTESDLVVRIPDADVLITGDLVEQGADPQFDDGYPLAWATTLDAVLAMVGPGTAVVPGHGAVTDLAFATAQQADIATLAGMIRRYAGEALDLDGATAAAIAAGSAFDRRTVRIAMARGYRELGAAGT